MTDKQLETSTPPSHLAVTAGRVVNIQRVGERARVRAEVLGAVPDAYIALREACGSPESQVLRLLSLRVEDLLILRFLREGVVYGFRTAVSRLVTDPEYLVFVHYPRLVEHVSVRREPRTTCRMPCLVAYDGSGQQPGLMLDVSTAGCRIVGRFEREKASPSAGCPVTVTLALPGQTEPFQALGVVRRLDREGADWALGIAFDHEQRELYDALEPYLCLAPLR
ncbi:PilZ domain-containing protein [Nitrococcus mobilis]|uniref:PilZ domain-containing protein n=1 Tax=Nitrococcus mobilis TaxID=35797 RepID=UPI0018DDDC36|nr:PilZ domain-containing protein [Nitrococcus mobilis]